MGVKLKDIILPEQIDFKDLKGRAIPVPVYNPTKRRKTLK